MQSALMTTERDMDGKQNTYLKENIIMDNVATFQVVL